MTELLIKAIILLLSAIVLGALLVIQTKRKTVTAKSVDNEKRWAPAKPTVGGLIFALAIVGGQMLFGWQLLWANLALVGAFGIGLVDDLYRIGPRQKLIGQGLATAFIALYAYQLAIPWIGVLLFPLSALVMMNSINMLDNMDGASTIGSLPFWMLNALLFAVGWNEGAFGLAVLIGAIAFLIYNAYPSRMFMGDSGSMLLGIASVLCMMEIYHLIGGLYWKLLPLWAFVSSLTLVDTALVVIRRLQHGKSPMQGGKDHSTHHLVYAGWSQTKVTYVFLAMALVQALIAFFVVALECAAPTVFIALSVYPLLWFIFIWKTSETNLKSGKFDYTSH